MKHGFHSAPAWWRRSGFFLVLFPQAVLIFLQPRCQSAYERLCAGSRSGFAAGCIYISCWVGCGNRQFQTCGPIRPWPMIFAAVRARPFVRPDEMYRSFLSCGNRGPKEAGTRAAESAGSPYGFGILRGRTYNASGEQIPRNRIAFFAALAFRVVLEDGVQRKKQVLCGGRCFDDFQIAVVINIEKNRSVSFFFWTDAVCFTNPPLEMLAFLMFLER